MSAMQEEIQSLIHQMENRVTYTKGKRKYYTGTLFNREVVLVFSRWGKVASATTATQLINDFNLRELIFTGVAGAVSPILNIGDIVIGKGLVQHDMNAFPLYKSFEIPLLHKTFFITNSDNRKKMHSACDTFIKAHTSVIPKEDLETLHIVAPKVLIGDIASGDQFVSTKAQVDFLNSNLKTVLCTEMEGASVAQVCYEYDMPFSIIRIISDNANSNSSVDFPVFAKKIASKYALYILENYFKY